MELDNGRDGQGRLSFGQQFDRSDIQINIPKVVWFVDSHGQPDLHKSLSTHYDHVFFSVWDKRTLFAGHPSAHWCPNATDPEFFYPIVKGEPEFDFGFFGSKTGLERSNPMIEICKKRGWTYDVRQVGGGIGKHKWPRTGEAMNNCRTLFNHGQKHDGPNLRVVESMAVGRPLITDIDPRSGMDRLFEPTEHYLGYEAYSYKGLEEKMEFAMAHPGWCISMADNARKLVLAKHLIVHRVEQILEVLNAAS
jgi:spore maturation protein CgeB